MNKKKYCLAWSKWTAKTYIAGSASKWTQSNLNKNQFLSVLPILWNRLTVSIISALDISVLMQHTITTPRNKNSVAFSRSFRCTDQSGIGKIFSNIYFSKLWSECIHIWANQKSNQNYCPWKPLSGDIRNLYYFNLFPYSTLNSLSKSTGETTQISILS